MTSEALYHLLGGKAAGWVAMRVRHENDMHWFIYNKQSGQRIDATARQFTRIPPYARAIACGFLTKRPSKRARILMKSMVWQ